MREGYFEKGAAFLLYKIVDHAVDASFPMLRKMGQKLERIEDDIFEGKSDEIVRDISNAKQEIINFRRIVRPQRVAFRDLERAMDVATPEELDVYFDDVIDASERIWDTLENYKEVVEGLEDSNESVTQPPHQRHPARADLDHRHRAAADPAGQPLRHERGLPRRGRRDRLLGHHDRHGHRLRGHGAWSSGCRGWL